MSARIDPAQRPPSEELPASSFPSQQKLSGRSVTPQPSASPLPRPSATPFSGQKGPSAQAALEEARASLIQLIAQKEQEEEAAISLIPQGPQGLKAGEDWSASPHYLAYMEESIRDLKREMNALQASNISIAPQVVPLQETLRDLQSSLMAPGSREEVQVGKWRLVLTNETLAAGKPPEGTLGSWSILKQTLQKEVHKLKENPQTKKSSQLSEQLGRLQRAVILVDLRITQGQAEAKLAAVLDALPESVAQEYRANCDAIAFKQAGINAKEMALAKARTKLDQEIQAQILLVQSLQKIVGRMLPNVEPPNPFAT